MNVRTLLLTTAALVSSTAMSAQTAAPAAAPAAPEVSWTLTAPVVSQYMFRGVRLGGPSFQPSLEMGLGDLAVGVWTNFPLKDKVEGQSDPEIDLYASYKIAVGENVTIQPGFTYYAYPDADKNAGFYKSSFEPSLAVNFTLGGVALTPKIYYDTVIESTTYELNAAYALPLKELGTELAFNASIGTFMTKDYTENASPSVKNWGDYWLVGVTLPFQITANSKLSLGLAYTKGTGNYLKQGTDPKFENSAAVGRGVVTVAYALSF